MGFTTSRPLRFGDCDPSGIAYYPAYLDILVGVHEEFFAALGLPWREMLNERGIGTPTARLEVTFVSPGFHGDQLDFAVHVRRVGERSVELESLVRVGDRPVWSARHVMVATSLETRKSILWPEDFRAAFLARLEPMDA